MTVPTAPVAELRSPLRAEDLGWDPLHQGPELTGPGLETAGPPCSLPPLPGGLLCMSHQFVDVEGVGPPRAVLVRALDGATVRDNMWNQKNMKKEL